MPGYASRRRCVGRRTRATDLDGLPRRRGRRARGRGTRTAGSSGCATRAWTACRSATASVPRRLALVVRRALPAQAARRGPGACAPLPRSTRSSTRESPRGRLAVADAGRASSRTSPAAVAVAAGDVARRTPACGRRGAARAGAARARRSSTRDGRGSTGSGRRGVPVARQRGVAAFVHCAFWRRDRRAKSAYIGPVLRALEPRVGGRLHLVGVGPRTNFRVRRWCDRLSEFSDPAARALPLTPVELLRGVGRAARRRGPCGSARREPSTALHAQRRTCGRCRSSTACDLWPLVAPELAGIADLQFPWSARAMDEAGAALDALEPRVGRDLRGGRRLGPRARARGAAAGHRQRRPAARLHLPALAELPARGRRDGARRRPTRRTAGFPRPDLHAALRRLRARAPAIGRAASRRAPRGDRQPAAGAVRRDGAARSARGPRARSARAAGRPGERRMSCSSPPSTRSSAVVRGARRGRRRRCPDVVLRRQVAPGRERRALRAGRRGRAARARGAGLERPRALLTAVARAVVTVNSTVAIDAMALGVPALVVGLPDQPHRRSSTAAPWRASRRRRTSPAALAHPVSDDEAPGGARTGAQPLSSSATRWCPTAGALGRAAAVIVDAGRALRSTRTARRPRRADDGVS